MPSAPIARLRKKDIVWLARHYCKHRHTYLVHYNCYLTENPLGRKVGFFDIEASHLKANFGLLLCYCIKPADKGKILHRTVTQAELRDRQCLDREVVKQCIADLQTFDSIVTHYGKRFDIPFLRSRALFHKLDFPAYGEIFHEDTYFMCRSRLCISSNRLETACQHVLGKSNKTRIDPGRWIIALQGDEKALAYILDHCKRDVRDLEGLYNALVGFTAHTESSI